MRYLTRACPDFGRVILVESGPRSVLNIAVPRLRGVFGSDVTFDLVTCFPGIPATLAPDTAVWRTQDHATPDARRRLVNALTATGATVVALICSGDPIMTRWKWWLAWQLPAKVLLINENGDCFWLDTGNLQSIRRFASVRLGLSGEVASRTLGRLLLFPFVLVYLLLYASVVHARRALRLVFRSHSS